jgi:hypothetical protein
MMPTWSKIGVVLALFAVASIWMMRSPAPPSELTREGERPPDAPAEHWPALEAQPQVSRHVASRDAGMSPDHLHRAKERRPHTRREVRRQRPPELEADPQFQKLLAIDSARKMALLEQEPEELARVRRELLAEGPIPRRVLEGALLDPNAEVRLAALYEISAAMEEAPLDLLTAVLHSDPSAEIRLEALSVIAEAENEEADALIESALDDPDEGVREEAQDLIDARIDDVSRSDTR